LLYFIC